MVIKCWGSRGSIFTHALDLALEAGVGQLGLFHLNQERTNRQMDEIVEDCRYRIAEKGNELECFAVCCDMIFNL